MKNTITGLFKVEDMGELNPLLHVLERTKGGPSKK